VRRFWKAISDWYEDWGSFIWLMTLIGGVLTGLGMLLYGTITDNREQCHRASGHIIKIHGSEICVDHDNRVIIL
jgi:hypothetical protein